MRPERAEPGIGGRIGVFAGRAAGWHMGCSPGRGLHGPAPPEPDRPRSPGPLLRRRRGADRHARRVYRHRARRRPQLPRHRDQGAPRRPRRAAAGRGTRPRDRAGHRPVRDRRRRRHPGAHRGRGRGRSGALQGGRGRPLRSAPARPADPRVRRDGRAAADAGAVRHDASARDALERARRDPPLRATLRVPPGRGRWPRPRPSDRGDLRPALARHPGRRRPGAPRRGRAAAGPRVPTASGLVAGGGGHRAQRHRVCAAHREGGTRGADPGSPAPARDGGPAHRQPRRGVGAAGGAPGRDGGAGHESRAPIPLRAGAVRPRTRGAGRLHRGVPRRGTARAAGRRSSLPTARPPRARAPGPATAPRSSRGAGTSSVSCRCSSRGPDAPPSASCA